MNDLALRLGKHRCKWIKYPKDCKDLNDAFVKYGEAGVRASIATAQYIAMDGLYAMDDLPPVVEQEAYAVGISKLADHFKLRRGDFSVVTGIPSHGKSTFVNNVCYNMAHKHNWNITFASFEQPPQTEHRRALRTLCSSKPHYEQTPQDIQAADLFINKHFSFIVPSDTLDEDFDLTWLVERMAAAVTRYNADMIVIDPWNEIDHVYDQREESVTQYVGRAIKTLKRFARSYNVHVMVVAHPAKMKKDKDGVYPVPSAYDISDSAHWYNKPEQIIVVHRENDTDTLIRISKSRYHYALGTPADVTLWFNRDTGRYS
jgi:twinkle protein